MEIVVYGAPVLTGLIEIALGIVFVIGDDVTEHKTVFVQKQIRTKLLRAEPIGFYAVIRPILFGQQNTRRSTVEFLFKGLARVTEEVNAQNALLLQFGHTLCLHNISVTHTVPAEGVFLTGGKLGEIHNGIVEILFEIPSDDLWRFTRSPNRLKGIATAQARLELMLIVAVNRVDTEHSENGCRNGVFGCFGRTKHILLGSIVCTAVISAPKGICINAELLTADAERLDIILFAHIIHRMGIKKPRSDNLRVITEKRLEFCKHFIDYSFTVTGLISLQKSAIDVPVPIIALTASPLHSELFDKLTAHFKPNTEFDIAFFDLFREKFGKVVSYHRIILQQVGVFKTVFTVDLHLVDNGRIKISVCFLSRIAATDKIHQINCFFIKHNIPPTYTVRAIVSLVQYNIVILYFQVKKAI